MKNLIKNPLALFAVAGSLLISSCSDDDNDSIIPNGGTIAGGPFTFVVDGTPDFVSGITLDDSEAAGTNSTWVITDDQNNILGLPPTTADLEAVDFDEAGPGVCLIWYLRYEPGTTGVEAGMNVSDISGSFGLSNSITVTRNVNSATIAGGPFTFDVDGTPDFVSGITADASAASGSNSTWVITDDQNNILGLPPTLADVEGVDFDAAGVGICFIWYLSYEDGLTGLAAGMNTADLDGLYALSNSIQVTRNVSSGTIAGGPFTFTVDGTPDFVSGITVDDTGATTGTDILSGWVITDDQNNILGLPPTLTDVEGVDFDDAGTGVCFIWYIRYQEGVSGLAAGMNTNDLEGFFDLSNSIRVDRVAP